MPLMIRNPKAAELARKLAERRGQTMTHVVVTALENELKRDADQNTRSLEERIAGIRSRLAAKSTGPGLPVTKADRDRWWGHE